MITTGTWTATKHDHDELWSVSGHAANSARTPLMVADDLRECNARLIAAAPELLAALERCNLTGFADAIAAIRRAKATD